MNKRKNNNLNAQLLTYQQVAEKSNLGVNTVMNISRESGAIIKIGKIARVDWGVFYKYILDNYRNS